MYFEVVLARRAGVWMLDPDNSDAGPKAAEAERFPRPLPVLFDTAGPAQSVVGQGHVVHPLPRLRPSRLRTVRGIRREMARVYADARNGLLEASEATRLTYILTCLLKVVETEKQVEPSRTVKQLSDEELLEIARVADLAGDRPAPAKS